MFLGIEIGGTKLQLGLGPGDGTISSLWRGAVEVAGGGAGIRERILTALPELLAEAKCDLTQVRAIGVGFGGPVDDKSQSTIKSHQIEGWDNFPLSKWLQDSFRARVALGNDADVAGLAEATFGAGKGLSPMFYITIGSGIGGGLIVDGKIFRGVGHGAAEIGHLRIPFHGTNLPLEQIASGWGIEQRWRRSGRARTAKQIGDIAALGDPMARDVLNEGWEYLAEAICHVITLLCPQRIVIGGGVSLMGEELLFEPLRRMVAERVFKPFAGLTDIVPAALGEEVVVHGALALARQRFNV